MSSFQTHIVGIISIDGLQRDARGGPSSAPRRLALPDPTGIWDDTPESEVTANNEQLQFELETAYLEFVSQVF